MKTILVQKRTEEGRRKRSLMMKMGLGDVGSFKDRQYALPSSDHKISQTLTSVTKDNLIFEIFEDFSL